jgi:hypothetical protein
VATNPEGSHWLAKWSRLPVERIRYVAAADEATLRSIRRGVLFFMAFWSVYSVQAFARLTEVLAGLDAKEMEVVVVDVDDSPGLLWLPEFKGKVHGAGEAAWVRDGEVVSTSGLGVNTACFEPNTLAMLSMP